MSIDTEIKIKAAEGTKIRIKDKGEVLELCYDGAVCQHPGSLWWGTAVGFRAMQVAALALSEDELWSRDNLYIVTGHPGGGVRDAVNYVTNVVESDRYKMVVAEGCGMQCNSRMKYEWWVCDGRRTAKVWLHDGFVPVDFYSLMDRLGTDKTTKDDIRSFSLFKVNLSTLVWNAPLEENFSVDVRDEVIEPGDLPKEVDEHYFETTFPPEKAHAATEEIDWPEE